MKPESEIPLIVVKKDMGIDPISHSECTWSNPKAAPVYEELQKKLEQQGWADSNRRSLIDDLFVGPRIWQDKSDGHYYFGLRAYRRSNPPADVELV